jgi:hypothetical protein
MHTNATYTSTIPATKRRICFQTQQRANVVTWWEGAALPLEIASAAIANCPRSKITKMVGEAVVLELECGCDKVESGGMMVW